MTNFFEFLNSGLFSAFFSAFAGAFAAFLLGISTDKRRIKSQRQKRIISFINYITFNQKALDSISNMFQDTISSTELSNLLKAYDEYYNKRVEVKLYPVQEAYRELSMDIFSEFDAKISKDIFDLCNIQEELCLKQIKQLSEYVKSNDMSDEEINTLRETVIQILLKITKTKTLYSELKNVFKENHY